MTWRARHDESSAPRGRGPAVKTPSTHEDAELLVEARSSEHPRGEREETLELDAFYFPEWEA